MIQTDLNIIKTTRSGGQFQELKAIKNTSHFLYAVGTIAFKNRVMNNRSKVERIKSFTLDLLVLARKKTVSDRKKESAVKKKKKARSGQLGIDGVKLVDDNMTVLQVILVGPVARQTSKHGTIQNVVLDKTTYGNFIIQPPDDPDSDRLSYHYIREMCIKQAIGKNGYYAKDTFVVGVNSKLFIRANGNSNIADECGPSTAEMWLAFNQRRASAKHMNIKVNLCLGFKQRKTMAADCRNFNVQTDTLEEARLVEHKTNASSRAASQKIPSGVNQFMYNLYNTPESPCFHAFSEEMYETGLLFYAVEEYEGKSYINFNLLNMN